MSFILLVLSKIKFIILGLILPVAFFGNYFNSSEIKPHTESELMAYAEEVLNKCKTENYGPPCYDKEIPKLMDQISMAEAFQVARYIQEKEPAYLYCHVLGHNIAETETAKDPSKWKDVVAKCPTTMCNNGCPHGALMERFKSNVNDYLTDEQIAEIKPDLMDVCEPRENWNPKEIERSMCYHALGHLHMYITNADLRKSAELCREVGTKSDGRNYIQTCTEGVFMSVYQPLSPEDIALIKNITPTKETMPKFCEPFKDDEMSFHACHKEAWAIFREEISTPEGYQKFCSYTDDKNWRVVCYSSLMNPLIDVKVVNDNNIAWLENFCGKLTDDARRYCIRASAHRLMQIDPKLLNKALEVCRSFVTLGQESQDECYDSLAAFGVLGYQKGSAEFNQYCSTLPKPWNETCLNHKEGF